LLVFIFFFFQAEDGIHDFHVTGVQTCALPISFDKSNNLWPTNAGGGGNIKVPRTTGNWQSYHILDGVNQYWDIVTDKNNTKWVASKDRGLIGFNENYQNRRIYINNSYSNGLPINNVRALAIDKNNRLWIGTQWGLRILPNIDRFLTE